MGQKWDKRVRPFCICFYCICRRAKVDLRRIIHPFRRVTAHASRHSAHNCEGEGKRGLGMGFHRVNYTIFAALCVDFRGRFPWPRKVSVVRREQIRVLNKNRTPARASALRTTFGRWICANCTPARASASRTRSARGICGKCRGETFAVTARSAGRAPQPEAAKAAAGHNPMTLRYQLTISGPKKIHTRQAPQI